MKKLLFVSIMFLFYCQAAFAVTKISEYNVHLSGKEQVAQGKCWARSVASDKKNAWRCMVGNSIFDPCFKINPNKVLCVLDPNKPKNNIIVKLTKPLPKTKVSIKSNSTFSVLYLADGAICYIHTGTLPLAYYNNKIKGFTHTCINSPLCNKNDKKCYVGLVANEVDRKNKDWLITEYRNVEDQSVDIYWRVNYTRIIKIVKVIQ